MTRTLLLGLLLTAGISQADLTLDSFDDGNNWYASSNIYFQIYTPSADFTEAGQNRHITYQGNSCWQNPALGVLDVTGPFYNFVLTYSADLNGDAASSIDIAGYNSISMELQSLYNANQSVEIYVSTDELSESGATYVAAFLPPMGTATLEIPTSLFAGDSQLGFLRLRFAYSGYQHNFRINGLNLTGGDSGTVAAEEQPASFQLAQNHPNPFNPATQIEFSLAETGPARLQVSNLAGQQVATLVDGMLERGAHSVSFNAGNLPSGLYFYTLEAAGLSETRKMLLSK